ncbi:uncharacterized protein BDFB_011704 [Asbolus verrucosus]|uniref:Cyclase domain containing protein n=1 Tax=Asbolus verrucosus TaxID=1661398 RepID=A0A482WAF3_ASBVE|nr:uncharacterized protein BDFB_011704 [Asbolus verrucosus]
MLITLALGVLLLHAPPILCVLTKIVDLTWDFSNETIHWGDITPFHYTKIVGNEHDKGYWYAMNEFCVGEHGGHTHFDAPYHFSKEGWKVADVPVSRLVAKGATLEVSNGTKLLLPQHLEDWVRANGQFEDNTVLLVKFGRSQYWPDKKKYVGVDSEGNWDFPGISAEAANWIVRSGKIVGVGVDSLSIDPASSTDRWAHRILSKAQIYQMESVKMLEELPAKGFTVVALPMKLKDGTGGPLRILALPKMANEHDRGYWYAMNEFCAGEHGGTHFDAPYHFNKEANWIVGSGKIVGVGVDTPSVDAGSNGDLMAHRILSKAQIYGMENVKIQRVHSGGVADEIERRNRSPVKNFGSPEKFLVKDF